MQCDQSARLESAEVVRVMKRCQDGRLDIVTRGLHGVIGTVLLEADVKFLKRGGNP